jgi:8-oxo-dGTP pyrophosphatase MutT (NUDIX family)
MVLLASARRPELRDDQERLRATVGSILTRPTVLSWLLHQAVNLYQGTRRLVWFFTAPDTAGVHAVPLTPAGKVVLVTLSYARGWRLPGGGRGHNEDAKAAVLRELREEIGMTAHGEVQEVAQFEHRPDFRNDRSSLFIVRDLEYRPGWSLEIKAVREFDLDNLPPDTARITQTLIAAAGCAKLMHCPTVLEPDSNGSC